MLLATSMSACHKDKPVKTVDPEPVVETAVQEAPAPEQAKPAEDELKLDQLTRAEFNRAALRLNLPLFWMYEETPNNTVRPEVITTLRFYPTSDSFVWKDADGHFTQAFKDAYKQLVQVLKDPTMGKDYDVKEVQRLNNVASELDQAAVTVVRTDFTQASEAEKKFVQAMLKAGALIDTLYAKQIGLDEALAKIPENDVLSRSMARRNWSINPLSPKMMNESNAKAIAGDIRIPVGVYPAEMQNDRDFCKKLDADPNFQQHLTPFTVVIQEGEKFLAIPYSEYYKTDMTAISNALKDAAAAIEQDPNEQALRKYLLAAADSFLTNDWNPADEAWAAMDSHNSKWYVRVAPDETYWEPCSRKAGFHQTFARINPDALYWQEKLSPIQQEMEERIAKLAGEPYEARQVSFHLPDFIDIVTNSGDDRDAFGATVGQSLPNWGPVANEGRGRTVAMSNLYTDPDSLRDRLDQARSMFGEEDVKKFFNGSDKGLGMLGTIIHEACHNLGPAHEYKVNGKVDDEIFGGGLATLAEEFKAQTGALWFLQMLVEKQVIDQDTANKSYADSLFWIFGQISRGLYDSQGNLQPYPQLAAIQLGMMLEDGAVTFDPELPAANGTDKGVFVIHAEKMPACAERIMTEITRIKATGNKENLVNLQNKHINGKDVPFQIISERMLRLPKTSFVYAVEI